MFSTALVLCTRGSVRVCFPPANIFILFFPFICLTSLGPPGTPGRSDIYSDLHVHPPEGCTYPGLSALLSVLYCTCLCISETPRGARYSSNFLA